MTTQIIPAEPQSSQVIDVRVTDAEWRVRRPAAPPPAATAATAPAETPTAPQTPDVYLPWWFLALVTLAIILATGALIVAMSASGRNIAFVGIACGATGLMTGLVLAQMVRR